MIERKTGSNPITYVKLMKKGQSGPNLLQITREPRRWEAGERACLRPSQPPLAASEGHRMRPRAGTVLAPRVRRSAMALPPL